jgi:hypothetical protein
MDNIIIVKCNPAQHRGALRGYTVTTISAGQRRTYDLIARNGKEAVELVRACKSRMGAEAA